MRLFIVLYFILISMLSAQTDYKQIIMTSTVSQKNADEYLNTLVHKNQNRQLLAEKEKYGFEFIVKPSGKYYIVSIGPFEDKKVIKQILPLVRKIQPDAYVSSLDWDKATQIKNSKDSGKNRTIENEKEQESISVTDEESPSPEFMLRLNPAPVKENLEKSVNAGYPAA